MVHRQTHLFPSLLTNVVCCIVRTCYLSVLFMYANEQLKPASTECRAAIGQCDVAEYCSGSDPLCPSDVHRRNTDTCTVDSVRTSTALSTHTHNHFTALLDFVVNQTFYRWRGPSFSCTRPIWPAPWLLAPHAMLTCRAIAMSVCNVGGLCLCKKVDIDTWQLAGLVSVLGLLHAKADLDRI